MNIPEGVTIEKLVKVYNNYQRKVAQRTQWYQTEEGKAYNRAKAKEYYQKHKAEILAKRAERYEADRETLLSRANEYYKNNSEELNAKARHKRAEQKTENPPAV